MLQLLGLLTKRKMMYHTHRPIRVCLSSSATSCDGSKIRTLLGSSVLPPNASDYFQTLGKKNGTLKWYFFFFKKNANVISAFMATLRSWYNPLHSLVFCRDYDFLCFLQALHYIIGTKHIVTRIFTPTYLLETPLSNTMFSLRLSIIYSAYIESPASICTVFWFTMYQL